LAMFEMDSIQKRIEAYRVWNG